MELSKCLGCMEPFQGYPCPRCGFDPKNVKGAEYALPLETILAGKYLVGRVLGQGGFGITYIGWDIALERKVAIKEYFPSGQVSRNPGTRDLTWYTSEQSQRAKQDGMQMFLKEARKMSKVDDIPNVVRVRDLFQENGTAYIVMDFVEGETLKARLQRTGPMSWEQAKEIFLPAIRAMEQVHKAGLVHRDLSPDNLMLTPEGRVMILDLGAAKDLNVNNGASSMQVAKGGFSPFEQYTQRGASGPWTDVYAMAATLYFTLTGKLPPVATDRVDEDTISWTEPGLKALPAPALEALQKAMEVSAKKRTQSMAELGKGLTEVPEALSGFQRETRTKNASIPKSAAKPKAKRITVNRKMKKLGCVCAIAVLVLLSVSAVIQYSNRVTQIAAGIEYTVGLRNNGTVTDVGTYMTDYIDIDGWKGIIDISGGYYHVVGLRRDGTVVSTGDNEYGQCNTSDWTEIAEITASANHTIGLRKNGTLRAIGDNSFGQCNVRGWGDIVSVAAGELHTVGLREDGTVVAVGANEYGECDTDEWRDIVAVAAGFQHTVGLRRDGTVVSIGGNYCGQCNTHSWRNIVAIYASGDATIGVHKDGTVVAVGRNDNGELDVSNWQNIVDISMCGMYTAGLRRDGTVVTVGLTH